MNELMYRQGEAKDSEGISDAEVVSFADALFQRHGIDFRSYEILSFKRRLSRAIHVFGLSSVHELWMKMLFKQIDPKEFIDQITVGLTAMFRDPALWIKLRELLQGEWSEKPHLRIWHAGCSTGEEVLTMAIVLRESGFRGSVSILATDINNGFLSSAAKGLLEGKKVIEYKQNYRQYNSAGLFEQYYHADDGICFFNSSLLRDVKFQNHNLLTSDFEKEFDLIFCRNVMIYFDVQAKATLFQKFYDALAPGGIFIAGSYDVILPFEDAIQNEKKFTTIFPEHKIFKRIG